MPTDTQTPYILFLVRAACTHFIRFAQFQSDIYESKMRKALSAVSQVATLSSSYVTFNLNRVL